MRTLRTVGILIGIAAALLIVGSLAQAGIAVEPESLNEGSSLFFEEISPGGFDFADDLAPGWSSLSVKVPEGVIVKDTEVSWGALDLEPGNYTFTARAGYCSSKLPVPYSIGCSAKYQVVTVDILSTPEYHMISGGELKVNSDTLFPEYLGGYQLTYNLHALEIERRTMVSGEQWVITSNGDFGSEVVTVALDDEPYTLNQYLGPRVRQFTVEVLPVPMVTTQEDGDQVAVSLAYLGEINDLVIDSPFFANSFEAGILTLIPAPDYFGHQILPIQAEVDTRSGLRWVEAAIDITVVGVNDPPVVSWVGQFEIPEDAGVITLAGNVIISDIDSDPSYSVQLGPGLSASLGWSEDIFVITSDQDWYGETFVTLVADDGEFQVQTDIPIQVQAINDPPVAIGVFEPGDILEDEWSTTIDLTDLFFDPDSEMSFTFMASQALEVKFNPAGYLAYRGLPDWFGEARLTVTASDGQAGTTLSMPVKVTPVNDPPYVVTAPGSLEIEEDTDVFRIDITGIFSDVEDSLTVTVYGGPGLKVGHSKLLGWYASPLPDYWGPSWLDYSASDGQATADVRQRVTITGVNDPPVPTSAIFVRGTYEDLAYAFDPAMLFSDVDSIPTYTIEEGPNHTASMDDSGGFVIQPAPDFNGLLIITIRADDGKTQATIDLWLYVVAVNDPPVPTSAIVVRGTYEDLAYTFDPVMLFSDVDSIPSYTVDGGPNHTVTLADTGDMVIQPAPDFNGLLIITIRADDGKTLATIDLWLYVVAVNDPPVPTSAIFIRGTHEDQPYAFDPAMMFLDVDSIPTYTIEEGPNHTATMDDTGGFIIQPVRDFNGRLTVTIRADDGQYQVTTEMWLFVVAVNDPPVPASSLYIRGTYEDQPYAFDPSKLFSDVDSVPTYRVAASGNATMMRTIDGRWQVFPDPDFFGRLNLKVTADDGDQRAQTTIWLFVLAVDDAPTLSEAPAPLTISSMVTTVKGPACADLATDPDSILTCSASGPGGLVGTQRDGYLWYTWDTQITGTVTIDITISDGNSKVQTRQTAIFENTPVTPYLTGEGPGPEESVGSMRGGFAAAVAEPVSAGWTSIYVVWGLLSIFGLVLAWRVANELWSKPSAPGDRRQAWFAARYATL